MTLDEAVALSFCPGLSRVGLTARLHFDDPELREMAAPLVERARAARRKAERTGIGVLSWPEERFPSVLRELTDAPPALWYRGVLDVLSTRAVAIVGSRAASRGALELAEFLGGELAASGVTVVSGLARGVDSAAHLGALRTGRTLAVLGSGVDRVYPREHDGLAHRIVERGLVLSEYPPGVLPLPFHFPMRNRLISGLSRGVIVVEASEQSGSLITAACALEQGREVMAVPGAVLGGRNRGAHALIRDGAAIVESAHDVLEVLGWGVKAGPDPCGAASDDSSGADPLLHLMRAGEAYELDRLAVSDGGTGGALLARLLALELRGLVQRTADGRFMRSS